MKTLDISYTADGRRFTGYLAMDDSVAGQRPGVLVGHEGSGLSEQTKSIARRLAEAGYIAFALDYYGEGPPVIGLDQVMERLRPWLADPTGIRPIATAALQVLVDRPETDPSRIAAIGYCFGGTTVLELARSGADLKAVVIFHGGLATTHPGDTKEIRGKLLACLGTDDPIIPLDQRIAFEKEMSGAGVDWQMNIYGGAGHSFTNPNAGILNNPGFSYDAAADRRSWAAMLNLFEETLGQEVPA